jgi:hypothetical protein
MYQAAHEDYERRYERRENGGINMVETIVGG